MTTKLKKMHLTSVDLVRAGANPQADICLYKSAASASNDYHGKDEMHMLKIDKSRFNAEERAQYEALIAKAVVDPEIGEEEMEDEKPPVEPRKPRQVIIDEEDEEDFGKKCDTKKGADEQLFKAAVERQEARIAELEKSIAMKGFTEVAKKYAPLGENEEALAKTLYDMHQADTALYDRYVASLDKSLNLVEKSGLYTEIGKSGKAGPATAEGKIEAIAKSYLEKDPALSYQQALVKAWDNNPELIADYDREYKM